MTKDADGLTGATFSYQWLRRAETTDQCVVHTRAWELRGDSNATYTLVTADEGKAIKVRVSFTDDAGNEEVLTSEPTDAVSAAPPPPPDNVRAVTQKSSAVELTWDAPEDATITGYRIDRRSAANPSDQQRSAGSPRDNHTLVEDTGSADTSYTDQSAEKGVEYEYRVSARNEAGAGAGSDWVRAGPEPVLGDGPPGAPRNLTVTAGDREITLSWEPPEDNGNPPATRYRIERRMDGKDYNKSHWGIARKTTYTKTHLANGVTYIFRVKAENGSGNDYGPYGPPSEEVSGTPTSGLTVDLATPVLSNTKTLHHGMVQLDWEDIEDAGWYVVQYYHVKSGEWLDLPAAGVDIAFHGSSAVVSNLHGLSWLRVRAMSCAGESEWSQIEQLFGTKESDWEDVPVPEVAKGDQIDPCPVILGTPVLSGPETLHHGMVQLDWEDIEDAGWYVVQHYHVKSGEWLDLPAAGVDIAFHGSSAVVSNLHGLSWLRVRAVSCAGESEWSQIEQLFGTKESDWEGVPVPEVEEADEIEVCPEDADTPDNSPATGALAITGTAQVGEALTADTSGIGDADGLSNVQYEYQWLADDADISGATNATYTLEEAEEGKGVKVRVSFTDDAGNEETLTSAATDAVAATPASNSPATGAPAISGTAQVGETLTANTSGVVDADGLSNVQYEYQWLADDAEIAGATGSTYTLVAEDEGKAIKVQVSFTDDAGNGETLTSVATDAVSGQRNSDPTGRPTISGTPQAGQTLTANTTGISDADGLDNVDYSYQWIGSNGNSDTDIEDATDSTYTPSSGDVGKTIKVKVSFTDDADNDETLTSEATGAVAATVPSAPQSMTVTSGSQIQELDVSWQAPSSDGGSDVTGYKVQWKEAVDGWETESDVSEATVTGTTHTITGLTEDVEYAVRVVAVNDVGEGQPSYEATGTPISGPDLTVGSPTVSNTNPTESGSFTLSATVSNAGDGASAATTLRYYQSTDATISSADTEVGTDAVGELAAGGTSPGGSPGGNWQGLYAPSPAGTYYYGACVDSVTGESDTTNNCSASVTVEVEATTTFPDLEVGQPTVINSTQVAGGLFRLTTTVTNIGDRGSAATTLRYYQSTDATISSADTEVGTDGIRPLGGTAFTSADVTAPLTAGTYYYGACVDAVPVESDTTNNCSSSVTVEVEEATTSADLQVGRPTVTPSTTVAGGSFTLSATVSNTGTGASEATTLRYYLWNYQLTDGTISNPKSQVGTDEVGTLAASETSAESISLTAPSTAGMYSYGVCVDVVPLESDTTNNCSGVLVTVQSNSAATGAPTISGTAQVGQTLTADTSGIADADGLENVSFSYQWLADDAEIAGATGLTYTLADADEDKAIRVRVSFTDDAGNEETLTSAATAAVAGAEPAERPSTPTGLSGDTSHDRVILSWDDPGDASIDGYMILRRQHDTHAQGQFSTLVADTGTAETTYTDGTVTPEKRYTYRIKAINEHGESERSRWFHTDTPAAPTTEENTAATGEPTIIGTAQVGETQTADVSGISDADGLDNATFSYQWLADDAEITGATNATYTLADADKGKAIKVRVSFTDDAGNEETLTSAATDAVAAAEPAEPPAKPTGLSATASHDQVVLTWDDPQDDSITGYVILRRVRENDVGGEFSVLVPDTGTAATTYTDDTVVAETTYTYRIKAINEYGVSERSRWFHIDIPAAPVPNKPTGLSATATHDQVVLTWNDPGDDSITGYVVLRRLRYDDPKGHFDELVADTGTAAATYTDDTVAAGTSYTYRIKAINGAGPGERSRWYHIDTPAAP